MYKQLFDYIENFLNHLFRGFQKAHATQHALFKLTQSQKKEFDESGFVGTIQIELSKADGYMPHDLTVDKLEADGLAKKNFTVNK